MTTSTSSTAGVPPDLTIGLPTPAERPGALEVIFDGHCRICTGSVRILTKLDWLKQLAYRSLHDPEVAANYPDLSYDQLMDELYVIDRQGRRLPGAAGLRSISWRLPLLIPLALVMSIPFTMPLWRVLYQTMARNRYRFGRLDACENGTCSIHAHRQRKT